jgi:hypothetical protein
MAYFALLVGEGDSCSIKRVSAHSKTVLGRRIHDAKPIKTLTELNLRQRISNHDWLYQISV